MREHRARCRWPQALLTLDLDSDLGGDGVYVSVQVFLLHFESRKLLLPLELQPVRTRGSETVSGQEMVQDVPATCGWVAGWLDGRGLSECVRM